MIIAFDGQLFLDKNKTGIAWNAHNLILELAKYAGNKCVIQFFACRCTESQLRRLAEYVDAGCEIEYCKWFKQIWYKLIWAFIPVPHRLFFHTKPDITQFFNFAVPPGVRGKRVTMIHDMAYRSCPHTVDKKTRIWLELSLKKSCRYADHIITVSEFSKKEITKYLKVPNEKITVVPNAVDHSVYHPNYTKRQIQTVLGRYKIHKEYFLYLGTIEPRKNLERLIGAYARLVQEAEKGAKTDTKRIQNSVPQLVLAGKKGWLCEGIYEKASRLNLKNKIRFIGYVAQEDSPVLMCGARAFVFPSLYEGFGMPPLEAMACGTPVIISDKTALPEVAGDAGYYVNPESEKEIYMALKTLAEDDECREKMKNLGLEKAKEFTWEKSAAMLMCVYKKLCNA